MSNNKVPIKIKFLRKHDAVEFHRFAVNPESYTFSELNTVVTHLWGERPKALQMTYTDDEGDLVSFSTEEEWKECLEVHKFGGNGILRLTAQRCKKERHRESPIESSLATTAPNKRVTSFADFLLPPRRRSPSPAPSEVSTEPDPTPRVMKSIDERPLTPPAHAEASQAARDIPTDMTLIEKEESSDALDLLAAPTAAPPKAAWAGGKSLAETLREKAESPSKSQDEKNVVDDFEVVHEEEDDHLEVESHVSYTMVEEEEQATKPPCEEMKIPTEPEPVEEEKKEAEEEPSSPELKKIAALEVDLFYCRAPAKQRFLRACIQSLKGNTDEAIKQLVMAKKKGYNDVASLQNDPNLENARYHPRWTEICPLKVYSLPNPTNPSNVRSMEPQVLTLLSIFPHVNIEAASAALVASKGNLEEAVQHLLK